MLPTRIKHIIDFFKTQNFLFTINSHTLFLHTYFFCEESVTDKKMEIKEIKNIVFNFKFLKPVFMKIMEGFPQKKVHHPWGGGLTVS